MHATDGLAGTALLGTPAGRAIRRTPIVSMATGRVGRARRRDCRALLAWPGTPGGRNWGALPCDNPEKRPRSFAIPERVSEPNLANRPAHLHRHGAELRAQRGPPVGLPVASHGPRPRALSEVRAAHACRNGGRTHGERGARKRPPGECSPRCGAEAAWLANSHLYPTKGDRADRDSCDSLWPESRSFYRLTRAAHACPCGLPPQFRPSTALSFRPLAQESPATRPAPALATSSLTSRTARATARSLPPRAERRPTNSTKGSSTGCARLVKE